MAQLRGDVPPVVPSPRSTPSSTLRREQSSTPTQFNKPVQFNKPTQNGGYTPAKKVVTPLTPAHVVSFNKIKKIIRTILSMFKL